MLIGKNWKVESDELNATLSRRKVNQKTGVEYWQVHSYYFNLSNCLKGMVDYEVRGTGLEKFEEVVKKQEELYKLIEGMVK